MQCKINSWNMALCQPMHRMLCSSLSQCTLSNVYMASSFWAAPQAWVKVSSGIVETNHYRRRAGTLTANCSAASRQAGKAAQPCAVAQTLLNEQSPAQTSSKSISYGAGQGCQPQAAAQHQGRQAEGAAAQPCGTAETSAHTVADAAPHSLHLWIPRLQGKHVT